MNMVISNSQIENYSKVCIIWIHFKLTNELEIHCIL